MKISALDLYDVGCIEQKYLGFSGVATVLYGTSGCGKTTVLNYAKESLGRVMSKGGLETKNGSVCISYPPSGVVHLVCRDLKSGGVFELPKLLPVSNLEGKFWKLSSDAKDWVMQEFYRRSGLSLVLCLDLIVMVRVREMREIPLFSLSPNLRNFLAGLVWVCSDLADIRESVIFCDDFDILFGRPYSWYFLQILVTWAKKRENQLILTSSFLEYSSLQGVGMVCIED